MIHFYERIQGWFDFQDIYWEQVNNAKDGDIFVEVGSYKGRSAAFMAVEILNSGKKIDFYCVDIWEDESIYQEFLKNIEPVKDLIKIQRCKSTDFKIEADFVFIDAAHDFKNVNKDIKHWEPLAKVIGGHDYSRYWPGVKEAVQKNFKDFKVIGNSWLV